MSVTVGELQGNPGAFSQTIDLGDRLVQIVDSLGRINLDDLRGEVEEAGALCGYFGSLAARTTRQAKTLRVLARHLEAQVAKQARLDAKTRGDRITDPGVKEEVRANEQVLKARLAWLEAQEAAAIMENWKFTIARKQATCQSLVGLLMAEEGATRGPAFGAEWPPRTPVTPRRTPAKLRS